MINFSNRTFKMKEKTQGFGEKIEEMYIKGMIKLIDNRMDPF